MTSSVTVQITASVNAGICLLFPDGQKIWIDFFPDRKTTLFSYMTDDQWNELKKDPDLTPPDLILFTHTHPDHFSAARVKECESLWPGTPVYFPAGSTWYGEISESELAYHPLTGEQTEISLGSLRVRMIRTVHSGKEFTDTPHYSIFLSFEGKNIFVAGDALVTGDRLTDLLEYSKTELAVLTFPWASTSLGRERIEYSICPSHVLLYHIPNAEDDKCNFRKAAENGKGLLNCPDVRTVTEPGQTELFRL